MALYPVAMENMLASIGRRTVRAFLTSGEMARFAATTLLRLPRLLWLRNHPVGDVLLRQIYFTGFESLKIILPVAIAIGTAIIVQILTLAGSGNESLSAKVLVWVVVRELGPLLTALIVIARSGAAIATELGTMKLAGEIEALEELGISAGDYLVFPRIIGGALSVFVLTVYFEIAAIGGGFLVALLGWHLPGEQFSQGISAALTLQVVALSAAKSLIFGFLISTACCQQGLAVKDSATMVPQAATRGVMYSLFLVFFLDGLITLAGQHWPAT